MVQVINKNGPGTIIAEEWAQLYGMYLYSYAISRLKNPQQAEKIVQETIEAALKSTRNCDGKSSEREWLTGILKNIIIEHIRKIFKNQPFTELLENEAVINSFFDQEGNFKKTPLDLEFGPKKILKKKEFWSVFSKCLQQYPQRVREAFYLREIEKMDTAAICEILNVSLSNLHVILHRPGLQMCQALEPYLSNDVSISPKKLK